MMKSNYDKNPVIKIKGLDDECFCGTETVENALSPIADTQGVIAVDFYQGVHEDEIVRILLQAWPNAVFYNSSAAMKTPGEIDLILARDITDDELFGFMTRFNIDCYFDDSKVLEMRESIRSAAGCRVIYGIGAAYICPDCDVLIYADMTRWEIQKRFRRGEVSNVGVDNKTERAGLQYKRAMFTDWRILDRHKRTLMQRWDYVLDTNIPGMPKLATGEAIRAGLKATVARPFRLVPYFDAGPWGGQWMKEVCDLDRSETNYAWCFDCVPEENSLKFAFGNVIFEIPASDLVFFCPKQLLGEAVYGRFGDEFPIRFDFLDTMQGGNLSLQVHPLTQYIQQTFGLNYTQDESYYILDATDNSSVFLGIKDTTEPEEMLTALRRAQENEEPFDVERYIGRYPAHKHEHFSIPAGTIHCSGADTMVLEISATPFIYTFKLYDWGRLGLDGRPRPINIGHGEKVIQWDRRERWVKENLINPTRIIAEGPGWKEEHTGLHESEFIETRRHWFSVPVTHNTEGGVNVLNLVEGREAVVESPNGSFEPFTVHYAETFIVPASVGEYTIRPCGQSEGTMIATIKAYVRHNP